MTLFGPGHSSDTFLASRPLYVRVTAIHGNADPSLPRVNVHSTRAPAVGYWIQAGATVIFYVPDVVRIHGRSQALRDVHLYIGDGATLSRPMVRKEKQSHRLIGRTTIREQLFWRKKEGVRRMVITHCGSGIVKGDEDRIRERLRQWADEYGVTAEIGYDGMELTL